MDLESICIVCRVLHEWRKCFVVFQFEVKRAFDSFQHVLLFTFHSGFFFLSSLLLLLLEMDWCAAMQMGHALSQHHESNCFPMRYAQNTLTHALKWDILSKENYDTIRKQSILFYIRLTLQHNPPPNNNSNNNNMWCLPFRDQWIPFRYHANTNKN